MNYRRMADGSIVFPKRGIAPMVVPGYEPDPGDPYIFRPTVPPCQHRKPETVKLPCGKYQEVLCCSKLRIFNVERLTCSTCTVDDKDKDHN